MKFTKLEIADKTDLLSVAQIDLGFTITHELNQLKKSKKISDTEILKFKQDTTVFGYFMRAHHDEEPIEVPFTTIWSNAENRVY